MFLTENAGSSDPSGLDLAPLKRIHITAAAAIMGGALLDGYVLASSVRRWRLPARKCSFPA
jgi:putative MFS transporter